MNLFKSLIFLCVTFHFNVFSIISSEIEEIEELKEINLKSVDIFGSQITKNEFIKDKMRMENFDCLPFELKKMILENLSPKELFELMQLSKSSEDIQFQQYQDIVAEAFGSSYGNHYTITYQIGTRHNFIIQNDVIHLNNFKTFITFLKHFNSRIKILRIDNSSFRGAELRQTLEIIAENIASTLTKIEVQHIFRNELNLIAELSFPNVEELIMFSCNFRNETFDLSHSFPNLRRLSVTRTKFTDRSWIERNFTNLTHFQVEMKRGYFTEAEILRILKKNPNISSLGLIDFSTSILQVIDDFFPNIVNFGIVSLSSSFAMDNGMHHMKHVERFSFDGIIFRKNPNFIRFDKLKELQWHSKSPAELILIDFIHNHRHQIEVLDIENTCIVNEHLIMMANLTKLKRASIQFNTKMNEILTANGIWNFIKTNEQLKELRLTETNQKLRQNLYNSFTDTEITGWLEVFDPMSVQNGNVCFRSKSNVSIKYKNELKFLRERFLTIY